MKILFFIPAHENIEVLKNCIENIQKYIKNPIIVIHPNADWVDFDPSKIEHYSNTYILQERLHFQKWTSMLPIIRKAFEFSKNLDYDYFSIFHTNCLFIKPGLEEYIADNDFSFYEYPGYMHPNAIRCMERSDILKYVYSKNEVYNNQAEGNFYRKDLMIKMMSFLEDKLPQLTTDPDTGEECVLPTLSKLFGKKHVYPYLLMHYCKGRDITVDDVELYRSNENNVTVFYDLPAKSSSIFCLKPINRNMSDPIRQYINSL